MQVSNHGLVIMLIGFAILIGMAWHFYNKIRETLGK